MPVVTNTVRNAAGQPVLNTRVAIVLVTGATFEPAFTSDGTVTGPFQTTVDSNGVWSVNLPANSTYVSPTTTYYRVTETPPTGQPAITRFIVPNGAGPYQLSAIQTGVG